MDYVYVHHELLSALMAMSLFAHGAPALARRDGRQPEFSLGLMRLLAPTRDQCPDSWSSKEESKKLILEM